MALSVEDKEELAELFNSTINRHVIIDPLIHAEHHESYAEDLAERKVKRERWEAVYRQVMGWGIIIFLGAIGTAVSTYFYAHIYKP